MYHLKPNYWIDPNIATSANTSNNNSNNNNKHQKKRNSNLLRKNKDRSNSNTASNVSNNSETSKTQSKRLSFLRTGVNKGNSNNNNSGIDNEKKGKKKRRMFGWFNRKTKNENEKKNDKKSKLAKLDENTFVKRGKNLDFVENGSGQRNPYRDFDTAALHKVNLDNYSLYFILLTLLLRYYNPGRNFLKFHISSQPVSFHSSLLHFSFFCAFRSPWFACLKSVLREYRFGFVFALRWLRASLQRCWLYFGCLFKLLTSVMMVPLLHKY